MRDNEPKVLNSLLLQEALLSKIQERIVALNQLTKVIDIKLIQIFLVNIQK